VRTRCARIYLRPLLHGGPIVIMIEMEKGCSAGPCGSMYNSLSKTSYAVQNTVYTGLLAFVLFSICFALMFPVFFPPGDVSPPVMPSSLVVSSPPPPVDSCTGLPRSEYLVCLCTTVDYMMNHAACQPSPPKPPPLPLPPPTAPPPKRCADKLVWIEYKNCMCSTYTLGCM